MSGTPGGNHHSLQAPSAWVCRWVERIPRGGTVVDVACGSGRHAIMLAGRGYRVYALDRDCAAIAQLSAVPGVIAIQADLEAGPWPYPGRCFDAVVVTNYLFRPLLPVLVQAIAPGGVLIYETFAVGNERFGRPSNPEFLLRPNELLEAVWGHLRVVAFEDLELAEPKPAMVQRICAVRSPMT